METDKKYALMHDRFGKIATFERLPFEGGLRFRVTAPSRWHSNLASEWLRRRMEEQGMTPDQQHERDLPKWCRCHSRKRFKRLLMACGFRRDAANSWCDFVQTTRRIRDGNFSYQEAWLSYIFSTAYLKPDNPVRGSE